MPLEATTAPVTATVERRSNDSGVIAANRCSPAGGSASGRSRSKGQPPGPAGFVRWEQSDGGPRLLPGSRMEPSANRRGGGCISSNARAASPPTGLLNRHWRSRSALRSGEFGERPAVAVGRRLPGSAPRLRDLSRAKRRRQAQAARFGVHTGFDAHQSGPDQGFCGVHRARCGHERAHLQSVGQAKRGRDRVGSGSGDQAPWTARLRSGGSVRGEGLARRAL
jgi:hypothetical protein